MLTPRLESGADIYTVSRLNREARMLLEGGFSVIWLEGEISNLAKPASGHWYFSLKDAECQVRCAMFRHRNAVLRFRAENGLKVLARAQVSLYEGRGEFQLIIEQLQPSGDGALRLAFEQLQRKLHAEGLFNPDAKKPLPVWPDCIGIVTSPTGAAIRDILSVLRRRAPHIRIVIFPTSVQGNAAVAGIVRALAAATRADCDVLILARGGGSLEDLWAFNSEQVARAVADCALPVVTGIGHEVDVTIADLVADQRAATPSAAAELVSPVAADTRVQLNALLQRMLFLTSRTVASQSERLCWLSQRVIHPRQRLQQLTLRLDDLMSRLDRCFASHMVIHRSNLRNLERRAAQCDPRQLVLLRKSTIDATVRRMHVAITHSLLARESCLEKMSGLLHSVSPLATLNRGYAIAAKLPENAILRRAGAVIVGDRILIRLASGQLRCLVQEIVDESGENIG